MTETRDYTAEVADNGMFTVHIHESESATYTAEYYGAEEVRKRTQLRGARNFADAVRLVRKHLEGKYGPIINWERMGPGV